MPIEARRDMKWQYATSEHKISLSCSQTHYLAMPDCNMNRCVTAMF